MSSSNNIAYLERKEINVDRWNACIAKAENGLIYAYSYYLDVMCTNWDALVLNDYEAVMPLPCRKKWGIHYLYQPFFTSALGIFGSTLPINSITKFFEAIPKKFQYWDFAIHEDNLLDKASLSNTKTYNISERKNYLLNIEGPYEVIIGRYKRLAKRKLISAEQAFLQAKRGEQPSLIIDHYMANYADQHIAIKKKDYNKLLSFCQNHKENLLTYTALNSTGDIVAFYLLLADERNIYSILGGSTPVGKEQGAFYLLTNAVIQDYAGKKKVFRFEGSDIPGIAFFNSQFGSSVVPYYHIKRNMLPWPIRHLK